MKKWVNIASANQATGPLTPDDLCELMKSGPADVVTFDCAPFVKVGETLRYEMRNTVDLWALVQAPKEAFRKRAFAVIVRTQEGRPFLMVVILTDLESHQIRGLGKGPESTVPGNR